MDRFDFATIPNESKDPTEGPSSMPSDYQKLDTIATESDSMSHNDLGNVEGDIDFVQFSGCGDHQMFQLKDT